MCSIIISHTHLKPSLKHDLKPETGWNEEEDKKLNF